MEISITMHVLIAYSSTVHSS